MNILDLAKRTIALAEKATPGPWVSADDGGWLNANNKAVVESPWDNADDLAFIAHTRTAAPQLAEVTIALTEALHDIMRAVGTSTEAWHIANKALKSTT